MRRLSLSILIITAALAATGCNCLSQCSQSAGENAVRSSAPFWDLGCGAVGNSNAIRMADGLSMPRPTKLGPCNDGTCFTRPLQKNPPAAAAQIPCEPCITTATPVTRPATYCETGTCPVLPESALLCEPIDGVSDCFTRTEEELNREAVTYWTSETTKYGAAAVGNWKPSPVKEASPEPADLPTVPGVPELPQAKAKASVPSEPLPPVPQVSDMDTKIRDDVRDILTSSSMESNPLPEVELPPKLN